MEGEAIKVCGVWQRPHRWTLHRCLIDPVCLRSANHKPLREMSSGTAVKMPGYEQ